VNSNRVSQHQNRHEECGTAAFAILSLLLIGASVLFSIQAYLPLLMTNAAAERSILRQQANQDAALFLAVNLSTEQTAHGHRIQMPHDHEIGEILFQDVSGLIDLNTARQELLSKYFHEITGSSTMASEISEIISTQRKNGHRFSSVYQFLQLIDLNPTQFQIIVATATVHSGRREVNAACAPAHLIELLPLETDTEAACDSGTFRISFKTSDANNTINAGVIHIPAPPATPFIIGKF